MVTVWGVGMDVTCLVFFRLLSAVQQQQQQRLSVLQTRSSRTQTGGGAVFASQEGNLIKTWSWPVILQTPYTHTLTLTVESLIYDPNLWLHLYAVACIPISSSPPTHTCLVFVLATLIILECRTTKEIFCRQRMVWYFREGQGNLAFV